MRRIITLGLAALLLLACGGGMDPQAYFDRVQQIRETRDQGMQDLQAQMTERMNEAEDKDAELAAFVAIVEQSSTVDRDALADLEGLEPPSDAADAHEAFVAAYRANIEASEEAIAAGAEAKTFEAFFEALGSQDAIDANTALGEACLDLQAAADAGGVQIDLRCGATPGGSTASPGT